MYRRLARRATVLVALSTHVAQRLRDQGLVRAGQPVIVLRHPPLAFGPLPPPPFVHGGAPKLLFFGRLLAYKGLDLLSDALQLLGPDLLEVRIVGSGPDSEALGVLRGLPFAMVENRWIAEDEIAPIIAWADILVLPYREASQSGAAAAAIAAGRWVIATNVGGLLEQLSDEKRAILCPPDATSLAAAIRGLCETRPVSRGHGANPEAAWQEFAKNLIAVLDTEIPAQR